ncbi:MAG: tRNA glutamyl-Q(34) synthetase GluQRS [Silvibacterium sp.]|nr:tRNA glutamyl-Q(34) synthetase GluQRS [Silvibacterium sp.]
MASTEQAGSRQVPSDPLRNYRGRLAPSPTGLLHLGHASTFFEADARAREARGTLVLRSDDLDAQRSRPEFYHAMLEDLAWLGIYWQEGPDVGGPFAPYSESERRDHYLAAWRRLLDSGFIYPCRCSRKDLAQAVSAPQDNDDEPRYPGTCRPSGPVPRNFASPAGINWRFRVPDGEPVAFEDGYFGAQKFIAGTDFGDFLIWRRDDVPAYQLACVVDDAGMRITEVVRGADLLRSTARQILLYRALGVEPPAWYHCPLIVDDNGQRLAKRHDALAIRALREQGKTPEEVRRMAEALRPANALRGAIP